MQRPLQVTFHNIPESAALRTRIEEKAEKLEVFYPRITGCHVTVEQRDKHKHRGGRFSVHIDVRVPGKEIAVTRQSDQDAYVALRNGFDAARRQLEDHARRLRGVVKAHELESHGRIARLFPDEGYGFIEATDGTELYFSRENVVHPAFERLEVGQAVSFLAEAAAGAEGPQARRVSSRKSLAGD